MSFPEIDLKKIKTVSIGTRKSKVEVKNLANVLASQNNLSTFLKSLPKILKALDFNLLIEKIIQARRKGKPLVWMLGGHVIKCGLSPILIDLMNRKFITTLVFNGASAIHDLELGLWGKTSEDVAESLETGKFGMVKETALQFNSVSILAAKENLGLGEALGKKIALSRFSYKKYSLLATAYRLKIPTTIHIAIGTDIVHQHPNFNPAFSAEASFKDFKILCEQVSKLKNGGVVLNIGSAVILPEVFLKALSVARNVHGKIDNFTTANFDMIPQYRPLTNVVTRPVLKNGLGLNFVGHHEIMIPLLAAGLKAKLK
ncbi:MAG: hypothetical protein A2145_00750 [candidate division Zixibacteria bacterium RBG_16_40_9]|nr:MAG: hypothetical protein A2145_00750 [candidate division Zixibacteria bacterium RBG_16_40_9]